MSELAVAPVASRRFGPWRSELLAFAELFAIRGLAVAQPMFDVAGKYTEIFSTRRTSPIELVAFMLVVLLVPPLFIKYPGQTAGTIDDRPARTVDILPTVSDALGIRLQWAVDGHTLRGPVRRDDPTRVFHWKLDARTPHRGNFNVVASASNFSKALGARASWSSGDPRLRIYRAGPHGALIGRPVAELAEPGRADVLVSVKDRTRFSSVDPAAKAAPWRASLPPQFFRAGPNDVRVDQIVGPSTGPRLRAVAGGA